jgi:hypothetical protein
MLGAYGTGPHADPHHMTPHVHTPPMAPMPTRVRTRSHPRSMSRAYAGPILSARNRATWWPLSGPHTRAPTVAPHAS